MQRSVHRSWSTTRTSTSLDTGSSTRRATCLDTRRWSTRCSSRSESSDGWPVSDADGNKIVTAKREKDVDVLCALAAVREAQGPATDLVILASSDSDLAPAIDEVQRLACAKIETFCWYDKVAGSATSFTPPTEADGSGTPSSGSRLFAPHGT